MEVLLVIMEALFIISIFACIIGWLWLVILAFQEGFLWGVYVLLVPGGSLPFFIFHKDDTKLPFIIHALSATIVLSFIGYFLWELSQLS